MTALLVVDVQVDFCEGGSLPVPGGRAVAQGVHDLLRARPYHLVVASQDWHVDPGGHFSANPDLRDSWPAHCVAGTPGAQLQDPLTPGDVDVLVRKGECDAAYSAFQGTADGVPLAALLAGHGVDALDVCGLATDYCVLASVLDARAAGLPVRLLLDLCAGVAADSTQAALTRMRAAGVQVVPG